MPVTLKSFSDLQLAHSLRAAEIEDDLASEAEERRSELRQELELLVYDVNSVQSELTSDQRTFLTERDRLSTQLARQRLADALQSDEARASHAGRLQRLQDEHSLALARLAAASPALPPRPNSAATAVRKALQSYERSATDLRQLPARSDAPAELALFDAKLREIEDDAAALARSARADEAESRRQLMESVVALDEQSCHLQEEVARIDRAAAEREAQYRRDLERVVAQIRQIRAQRARAREQRRARAAAVQREIDKIEAEFTAKMADAARVAARLRAALENAKLRRTQQLISERERASEMAKLLHENSALKIRLSALENDVRIESRNVGSLKKDATVAIGTRRAASLLI